MDNKRYNLTNQNTIMNIQTKKAQENIKNKLILICTKKNKTTHLMLSTL